MPLEDRNRPHTHRQEEGVPCDRVVEQDLELAEDSGAEAGRRLPGDGALGALSETTRFRERRCHWDAERHGREEQECR